jgi:hypothetical protein
LSDYMQSNHPIDASLLPSAVFRARGTAASQKIAL